ncbi:MAG: transglycosylase domain-containing protein [Arenimonas sp.]|nr:transglycosylase domain-containing protein [Arenimonas sp.]
MKYLKATFLGMFLLLAFYLSAVLLWANAVAGELLKQTPSFHQAIQIQPRHVAALAIVEDPAFFEHRGLNISNGQGLTTLTSVVARDLFLGNSDVDGISGAAQSFYRGVFDCCKRIDLGRDVMALVLDAHATKQQQLNMYLNRTYFGSLNGKAVIGFDAAANAYYGKDLSKLTDAEFFGLMAMPIAPNRYHPGRNPELHAERARRIAALVAGECEARGWLDLSYEDCSAGEGTR